MADTEKQRRALEHETEDLTQHQAPNQTRQLKARDNNEFRAIMKEADNIVANLTAKEDELLTVIGAAEKLQAALPPLKARLAEEEPLFAQAEADLLKAAKESEEGLEAALKRRQELIPAVEPADLSRYNTIAQNRDGQAIAPVVEGMCRVCRLSIPPQLFNELQKNDKLITCPNCARILYWMHHPFFAEFCTEPLPQEPAPATDKTDRKSKTENGKPRRASRSKNAKLAEKKLENDDSADSSSQDDEKVAHI